MEGTGEDVVENTMDDVVGIQGGLSGGLQRWRATVEDYSGRIQWGIHRSTQGRM